MLFQIYSNIQNSKQIEGELLVFNSAGATMTYIK